MEPSSSFSADESCSPSLVIIAMLLLKNCESGISIPKKLPCLPYTLAMLRSKAKIVTNTLNADVKVS